MSKHWTIYPPVASPEAAAYDREDHSDLGPEDLEPADWERQDGQESEEEAAHWRAMAEADGVEDPFLLAELDAEMQAQAEMLGAPDDQPAGGELDSDEAPF